MLSQEARQCVGWVMAIGCFFKLYPFIWDNKAYRLRRAGWFHLLIYNIHGCINCIMGTFSIFRFLIALKLEEFPPRIRILTFAWSLVYSLGIVCYVQFMYNKKQILAFANALLEYIDKCEGEGEESMVQSGLVPVLNFDEESGSKTFREMKQRIRDEIPLKNNKSLFYRKDGSIDWTSISVYTAFFLLIVNPPIHAIMVVDSPCAPHFVSSMGLPCSFILHNFELWDKFPYILVETILTGVFFFNFTFNWIFVFLGLAWIKNEMRKISLDRDNLLPEELHVVPMRYRCVQNIMAHLNASFVYYLEYSPSILMSVVALLAFGAIKYYHLHFTAYMMYPLCGGRCFFEAITQLGLAGYTNQDSNIILRNWKEVSSKGNVDVDKKYQKLNRYYLMSCPEVRCTAGSLYTFENTIVIASIHNCLQVTFNLLIMYK